jgi:hypothetical protein
MRRPRDGDQPLLFGVAVETGRGAHPTGDGGPGPGPATQRDGRSTGYRRDAPGTPPSDVRCTGHGLAQIQGAGVSGQDAVAGQEFGQRQLLAGAEQLVSGRERWSSGEYPRWKLQAIEPRLHWPGSVKRGQSVSMAWLGCLSS